MSKMDPTMPFHDGELQAQARAGVGDVAQWAGGFIRDHLPEQHRSFHSALPFLVISGGDADGRTWVTLLDGPDGFITAPDPRQITLNTTLDPADPLAAALTAGTDIGALGIDLATRRRNRFSGHMARTATGLAIAIRQSFGNCPQYIHARAWARVPRGTPRPATHGTALSPAQIARIRAADTMFIGSGHPGDAQAASTGYDASHRGGAPGFVHVASPTRLQIPDYAGNNFFNTIGNILCNPRIGLVFVDFDTGGLLHLSGRARIDWDPRNAKDPDAWRAIDVEIDAVIDRPGAVGLRWARQDHLTRRLRLAGRRIETDEITSFVFEPLDGRPLAPFKAGQHLPVEVQIPSQSTPAKRSYSLSGAPGDTGQYRLSVKREAKGQVSRLLHDRLQLGDVIDAHPPAGDFVIPCSHCPLVLVSAGVGLTPMVSMLHATAGQDRPVWFVHGARNGRAHALRAEVDHLLARHDTLQRYRVYSRPDASDILGTDYDAPGRLTADHLRALEAGPEAHYMLCGPAGFLADIRSGLEAAGVPAAQIHFETFGPHGPSGARHG
ncbi:pyridoxamine 5'-phosphate oxidase family protein [uncultured Roseobacter sp.]|uniref:FAD-binding oxidoreductase n=1 Tax=uncultured Roseobacter sp. TaxID=114847 RepID=UPI002601B6CB|nr:pyridoxamine 5'-phosphate oxidase family protein [uncultured Roseobacter sp.]